MRMIETLSFLLGSLAAIGGTAEASAKVFTAPRESPWRMVDDPVGMEAPASPSFSGIARPGEFFVFQVVVVPRTETEIRSLAFSPLTGRTGAIPASALRCISLGGTDYDGRPLNKKLRVKAGEAQVLWVGIDVPGTAKGDYAGNAILDLGDASTTRIALALSVQGNVVRDHGESSAPSLARLRWLDSAVGSEPTVTAPYQPVETERRTIHVLGRELVIGEDGLPQQIRSFFTPSNTRIGTTGRPVLAAPFKLSIEEDTRGTMDWTPRFGALEHDDLEARWTAALEADGLRADITGQLDYTGSGSLTITLTAERDLDLRDIRLDIPWHESAATYAMGLNKRGGHRAEEALAWKWKPEKRRQDSLWMGAVNAGLMVRLKGANYRRPLVNIYYHFRPLLMPESWGNAGKGGIQVNPAEKGQVIMRAYCGPRSMAAGETLTFIADFYLTPFRPIDTEKQWSVRFDHPHPRRNDPTYLNKVVAEADPEHDANVLNVHQAHAILPFINYPYADAYMSQFIALIKQAHGKGMRVRPYYTTREITQNMAELHALHSLNGEIIQPGPGADARTLIHKQGPHRWLIENLGRDFIPAWVDHIKLPEAEWDLSVLTTPDSRWNNFYLEGLRWLVEQADIDGIYIDDTALDARSLCRARRILDRKPGRLIDFHTWCHFNGHAGYDNNLNLYMELLPYFDRLWIGEGFNCNAVDQDYWLVEMSGLPFGVMSEMLQSVNPWRGLLFGEVARKSWSGNPSAIWQAWDAYGIQDTEMFGWFAPDSPVKTSHVDVPVTVYRGANYALLAIASWADETVEVSLQIDWHKLGIDEQKAALYAPDIADFQFEEVWRPGDSLPIAPGCGHFLVLDETPRKVTKEKGAPTALVETFRDPFSTPVLEEHWEVFVSDKRGASAQAFGAAFQVTAPANVHAGIQCALPTGTVAVEVEIAPDSDQGKTWGPGMALVWQNGQTAKLNLRSAEKSFEAHAGRETRLLHGDYGTTSTFLRILLDRKFVVFQVRDGADSPWVLLGRLARRGLPGAPERLRLGKLDVGGNWTDYAGTPGSPGICRFHAVSVFAK